MSRIPPPSFLDERDPLPWDENEEYYNNPHDVYLNPEDRDEYDDFAHERSRGHPQLPQPRFALTPTGSIRTSYHQPRPSDNSYNSSQYGSQSSRNLVTPPGQSHSPEHYRPYDSPPRSYNDYQREMSPSRADSPTRVPLTGGATGYAGYEMGERKADIFERPQTPTWRKEEQKTRRRRKWIIWGIIVFVILGAVAGVTVYLVKFRNSSSGGSSGSVDDGSSKGRNGAGSTAGNIQMDSKLKQVFDGMDYTPLNAQYPACGAIQDNVTADVATLSQLTKQVRLYGTDCNQTEMVLNAIQSLKVDMTVFVGVWVDTNATTLARQLADLYSILKKYPANLIDGIAVGNEVLFREDKTESELIDLISEVRTNVTAMNLGKTLPICTR
jgi:hypothetical protein